MSILKDNKSNPIIVSIDLGSNGIRAMAAEKNDKGLLRILGVEESNQKPCVKRGIVTSTSDASFMIKNIMTLLRNRINRELPNTVFVSVGGASLIVVEVSSWRDQARKREIAPNLLNAMENECRQKIETKNPGIAVLDVIPHYFELDKVEQDMVPTPDQKAEILVGHYTAFVGKKELKEKVENSFTQSSIGLECMFVRPDILLNAFASKDDLINGCAILDLGAQTTTLTIFKGTRYLYNKVIAEGGEDITRDIELLGIPHAPAEHLKCKYGMAKPEMVTHTQRYKIKVSEEQNVSLTTLELAETINNRLERILAPLLTDLIAYEQRISVIYITGGGSMLQGMLEYLQGKTEVPVEFGSHACWLSSDTPDEICYPRYASLVGTLALGEHYLQQVQPQKNKKKRKPNIVKLLEEKTITLFDENKE